MTASATSASQSSSNTNPSALPAATSLGFMPAKGPRLTTRKSGHSSADRTVSGRVQVRAAAKHQVQPSAATVKKVAPQAAVQLKIRRS